MAQYRRKNIKDNAVGSDQIALDSGKFLKAEKADKSGYVDILKLNQNNTVEFVVTPILPEGEATEPNQIIKLSQLETEKQLLVTADTNLQNQIDALDEASQELRSDLTTLSSQTSGATSSLSARIDSLELDPVTKTYTDTQDQSLQSQIDTEKSRVDAILSAADADKDSFAEIVSLINSIDTESDNAFASYVTSNNERVTIVEQNLAQEILNRETDVTTEETRALAAEGFLQSQITSEISAREVGDTTTLASAQSYSDSLHATQAAEIDAIESSVALEVTNRANADSVLQNQITTLENTVSTISSDLDSLDVYAQEARADLDALDVYAQEIRSDLDQEIADRISSGSSLSSAIANLEASIAQEVSTRQSAITNVESSLGDEISRAQLAESGLQSQITQEVLDRQADVNAEETRALAAESLLDSRLTTAESEIDTLQSEMDVVETSISNEALRAQAAETQLQTNIDVEKNRIDAILSASQADKDSFAEIVTLINSIDTENDTAFGAYVLSNNAALAQEVSDRQAGDTSTIESAKDYTDAEISALDQELTLALSQEVTNRNTAVTAEASAREAVDQNLQSQITQEVTNRESADSSLQDQIDDLDVFTISLQGEIDDINAFALSTQSDVDDLDLGLVQVQSSIVAETTRAQAAESLLDSRLDTVEPKVSTLETEMNAVETSIASVQASISNEESARITADQSLSNAISQETSNRQNAISLESSARELADQNLQSQITTEKNRIDSILLASDADKDSFSEIVQLINTVDTENDQAFAGYVLSNNAAVALKAEKTYVDSQDESKLLEAKTYTDNQIAAIPPTDLSNYYVKSEVDSKESALQTQINNLNSTYATDAELASETSRAQSAEEALELRLDVAEPKITNLELGLAQEVSDRAAADVQLSEQIDALDVYAQEIRTDLDQSISETSSSISAETSARIAADSELENKITTEKNRIDAILLASDADKDSFAEIVQLINSVDTTNDQAFGSYVLSNDAAVALKADKTYTDAQDEAKLLEAKNYTDAQIAAIPPVDLSAYETIANVDSKDASTLVSANSYTDSSIAAIPPVDLSGYYTKTEVDSFIATTGSEVTDLEAYSIDIRSDLDALDVYTQEIRSDLDQSISDIESDISNEASARQAADSNLQTSINNEISARELANTSLQSEINAVELSLSNETSRAIAAETVLDNKIETEKARIDSILNASQADKDSFAEIVTLINSIDTTNDQAFAGYVASNNQVVADLDSRLDTLEPKVSALEGEMDAVELSIANEVTRAQSAEELLDSRLNTVESKVTTLESEMNAVEGSIFSLEGTVQGNFDLQQSDIDGVRSDLDFASSSISVLESKMDTAQADLISLDGRLDAVEPKVSALELEMDAAQSDINLVQTQLTQEATTRENADSSLQSNIDALDVYAQEVRSDLDALDVYAQETRSDLDSLVVTASATESSLTQEIANRITGDSTTLSSANTYTDSAIASEVSSREAADLQIQNSITAEETRALAAEGVLSSGLSEEISNRQAADLALDQKISTEKARIDAILLASDADKDSFAEIVSLINSVDTTNDNAFASYVLSNDARSTSIENNLTQEISDRQAADTATLSSAQSYTDSAKLELDQDIADVVADLAQEVTDRQNAINTEAASRAAADTNLSSLIGLEESARILADQGLASQITQEVADRVAGDSSLQSSISSEITRATNAEATLTQSITDEIARATSAEEVLQDNIDTLDVYSQEIRSDLDDLNILTFDIRSELDQEVIDRATADSALSSQITALEQSSLAADTNLSNLIAAETAARQAAIADLLSNTDPAALDSLSEVVSAFQAADANLNNAISSLGTGASSALASEIARAQAAEGDLQSQITAEISRATSAEETITSNLVTEISDRQAADSAEQSARIAADNNLQAQINSIISNTDPAVIDSLVEVVAAFEAADSNINNAITSLANSASSALASETTRAQNAEENLQDQIDSLSSNVSTNVSSLDGRIDALEADPVTKTYVDGSVTTLQGQINFITANTDPAMLDSLTEVVTAFQQADSDLQNAISILTFGVSNQITVEQTARINADNALNTRVTALEAKTFAKKTITISGNYLSVDLDHNANVNSIIGFKNRIPFHLGHDFTTSVVSGKTRLTWIGDFASAGSQALVDGDKIFLTYYY